MKTASELREQERQSIIRRARKLLEEARIEDATAAHWNRLHPNEPPLPTDSEAIVRAALASGPGSTETH